MDKRNTLIVLSIIFIAGYSSAVEVGVVVTFPDNYTYIKCIDVPENTDAYDLLRKTDLKMEWGYSSVWGHSLCKVLDTGCPSSNCWCQGDKYWNLLFKRENPEWVYSPVGFDSGNSCGEHYCAKEWDMVGLAFGEYGVKPRNLQINEVCLGREITTTTAEGSALVGSVTASDLNDTPVLLSLILIMTLVVYFVYRYW